MTAKAVMLQEAAHIETASKKDKIMNSLKVQNCKTAESYSAAIDSAWPKLAGASNYQIRRFIKDNTKFCRINGVHVEFVGEFGKVIFYTHRLTGIPRAEEMGFKVFEENEEICLS